MNRLYPIIILLFIFSCSIWEYDDLSNPIDPQKPNTYLSLIASDTVFASLDSITGQSIYAITETPDPDFVWDTLTHAFTTITTSKQELHWWGEDEDGEIIGETPCEMEIVSDAIEIFKRICQKDVKFPRGLLILGQSYLDVAQQTNDKKLYEQAEKNFLLCSEIFPTNVEVDYTLSLSLIHI